MPMADHGGAVPVGREFAHDDVPQNLNRRSLPENALLQLNTRRLQPAERMGACRLSAPSSARESREDENRRSYRPAALRAGWRSAETFGRLGAWGSQRAVSTRCLTGSCHRFRLRGDLHPAHARPRRKQWA
jgi:hypothetical protein